MHRRLTAALAAATLLPAATAVAHELDHPAPSAAPPSTPSPLWTGGGEGAQWELVGTLPTGNPHTDLDYFRSGGDLYASVGALAIGPNGGGQHIVRLTEGGEVSPSIVSSAPTASCVSNPSAALGLQHDVEATPKGGTLLNTTTARATGGDAQLLLDATDQRGRCHDQGTALGFSGAPRGGLEILDITDPANPVTIGLTSHIGEAHTVNVDPKRPHIAYAVTSDSVSVDENGNRANEAGGSSSLALDGFEVVDLSSCMNFPAGTTLEAKRAACRPEVYRYRWSSAAIAMGHTAKNAVAGCHELEVYPNDRLTCAAIHASPVFDMAGAFDDGGTPRDYTDDRPNGTPLPCAVRDSSSTEPFYTAAKVTDCVVGREGADLGVKGWQDIGSPSLEGVRHLGTAFHQGRSAGAYDSTQDIEVSHEAELTQSGKHLIVTDERGGGVTPPGATCASGVDNTLGNGGLHAFKVGALPTTSPDSAEAAWQSYAQTPQGDKAIYRAPIRTGAEPTVCTSHVFQQIPGQNRIFMGWYSQGTQVVDYVERKDGTFEFREAGFFLPANTNQWVSHVFRVDDNGDGTFTYYGASADFALTGRGRNAIDIYKVTLPAPPGAATAKGGKGKR
jgi:hypothetical protein